MGPWCRSAALLGLVLLGLSGPKAGATILTFDQGTVTDLLAVDQAYGDDVQAVLEGSFGYGVGAEGFTPNVQVAYGAGSTLWTTGFGDLSNALFILDSVGPGFIEITLAADAGFFVQLFDFDVAAFTADFVSDPTIDAVRVTSGANTLFEQLDTTISAATHTTFDFSAAPLTAQTLVIRVDGSNLGSLRDDIAIDDLRFGQSVIPEPSTGALLATGLWILGAMSRKSPCERVQMS